MIDTPTPERDAAQRAWEPEARWHVIEPIGRAASPEETVDMSESLTCDFAIPSELGPITGVCFETIGEEHPNYSAALGERRSTPFAIGTRDRDPPDMMGKRIRIEIPDRAEYLALAEVEVYSGGKNVAGTGKAQQSSTGAGGLAERAIDGDPNGDFNNQSVSHTNSTMHPWWELVLPESVPVDRIVVWNRTDGGLEERLKGAILTVFDESDAPVYSYRFEAPPYPSVELDLAGPVPVPISASSSDLLSVDASGWTGLCSWDSGTTLRLDVGSLEVRDTQCLTLTLQDDGKERGEVRLSVYTGTIPLAYVPPEIDAILAKPWHDRSRGEAMTLAAFFRTIDPDLEPERSRLASLQESLK
jgi:hypothetical protein